MVKFDKEHHRYYSEDDDQEGDDDTYFQYAYFDQFFGEIAPIIFKFFGEWLLVVEGQKNPDSKQILDNRWSRGLHGLLNDSGVFEHPVLGLFKDRKVFCSIFTYNKIEEWFKFYLNKFELREEWSQHLKELRAKEAVINAGVVDMMKKGPDEDDKCDGCAGGTCED